MLIAVALTAALIVVYKLHRHKRLHGLPIAIDAAPLAVCSLCYPQRVCCRPRERPMRRILLQRYHLSATRAGGCIATAFVLWSWAVVGLSAIRWQVRAIRRPSPTKSDCYTDATMSAEALHYNYLRVGGALDWQAPPCWPSRLLLALLVVCDRLLAVLCPMRPVRVLVDTARKRDEREIPGLVHCEFFSITFW